MTIVRDQDGEGHAVLTVKTDRGDFVLDNLTDEILPWNRPAIASSSARRRTIPMSDSR